MTNYQWYKYFVLTLCAIAFLLFSLGLRGKKGAEVIVPKKAGEVVTFHEVKDITSTGAKQCSKGEGCHVDFPHIEDVRFAPFLNMHSNYMDCLLCHAPMKVEVSVEYVMGGYRFVGRNSPGSNDPHKSLEKTLKCRDCHSTAWKKKVEKMTGKEFESSFANPHALEILEEGRKKWIIPGF